MNKAVLFVSASMGAGHDGAAHELARRIGDAGYRTDVLDLLRIVPRPLAFAFREGYRWQLRLAPETYERSYRLYYRDSPQWDRTLQRLAARARGPISRAVDDLGAAAVVSTYALATLVLGQLRAAGSLRVPVVNFLTDFGIHPRTVHRGVDLHLAVHRVPAADAARLVTAPVVATAPAVAPRFACTPRKRAESRERLGLADGERYVVVAVGSWGVGDAVAATVEHLAADGRFRVATLCGNDRGLARRLRRRGAGDVIGWTPDVDVHLAAADAVVENAGGLTAFEAVASGAALVSYRPIPGHGRDNVRSMVRAGVTAQPSTQAELVDELVAVTTSGSYRSARLAAATDLFAHDPSVPIATLAATGSIAQAVSAVEG